MAACRYDVEQGTSGELSTYMKRTMGLYQIGVHKFLALPIPLEEKLQARGTVSVLLRPTEAWDDWYFCFLWLSIFAARNDLDESIGLEHFCFLIIVVLARDSMPARSKM